MANKRPEAQRRRARVIGLAGACITRILLLLSLAWLAKLTAPLFHLGDWGVSGRDIILIGGGLFLPGKSALEIHDSVEGAAEHAADSLVGKLPKVLFTRVIFQRSEETRVGNEFGRHLICG